MNEAIQVLIIELDKLISTRQSGTITNEELEIVIMRWVIDYNVRVVDKL